LATTSPTTMFSLDSKVIGNVYWRER